MPDTHSLTKPVIQLCHTDEETLQVLVDGDLVSRVTHDSVGWAGIEALESLVERLASRLGLEVVEVELANDE